MLIPKTKQYSINLDFDIVISVQPNKVIDKSKRICFKLEYTRAHIIFYKEQQLKCTNKYIFHLVDEDERYPYFT